MKKAIGQLKSKSTAYCTICSCSHTRKITADVFENTPEGIQKSKQVLMEKASRKYTCRICKSIEKSVQN